MNNFFLILHLFHTTHSSQFSALCRGSGKNVFYHLAAYIGQPVSTSLVFENKFFVIDSKQVQNGCLKIVNVHAIFYYVVAEFICFSINKPWLYTTSGHPDRK